MSQHRDCHHWMPMEYESAYFRPSYQQLLNFGQYLFEQGFSSKIMISLQCRLDFPLLRTSLQLVSKLFDLLSMHHMNCLQNLVLLFPFYPCCIACIHSRLLLYFCHHIFIFNSLILLIVKELYHLHLKILDLSFLFKARFKLNF